MILLTILLALIGAIFVVGLIVTFFVGGSFIAVFGDVILFILIVWLIVKIFRRKK